MLSRSTLSASDSAKESFGQEVPGLVREGSMQQCEHTGVETCGLPANWRQVVHAGDRAGVAFTMYSYWCEDHAVNIVEWRRKGGLDPAVMQRLSAVEVPSKLKKRRPSQ